MFAYRHHEAVGTEAVREVLKHRLSACHSHGLWMQLWTARRAMVHWIRLGDADKAAVRGREAGRAALAMLARGMTVNDFTQGDR